MGGKSEEGSVWEKGKVMCGGKVMGGGKGGGIRVWNRWKGYGCEKWEELWIRKGRRAMKRGKWRKGNGWGKGRRARVKGGKMGRSARAEEKGGLRLRVG